MKNPVYHAPTRAAINLSLPWHRSAVEIVDRNFNTVMGKLSKCMKSLNLVSPSLGSLRFFWGRSLSGYLTHNLEGYVPKPESLIIPSRPPLAQRTAEYQPFYLVPRYPDDP